MLWTVIFDYRPRLFDVEIAVQRQGMLRCFGGSAVVGAWRSLAARLLWEQEVAGSNPAAPTSTSTV